MVNIAGWKATEKLKNFYQDRISKFEDSRARVGTPEQGTTPIDSRSVHSSTTTSNNSKLKPRPEPERFKTTLQELFPDGSIRERECIIVDGVKLFISSVSPKLLQEAKMILREKLIKQPAKSLSSASNIRYSRDDLISLANNPSSEETPFKVAACSCPEILLKER